MVARSWKTVLVLAVASVMVVSALAVIGTGSVAQSPAVSSAASPVTSSVSSTPISGSAAGSSTNPAAGVPLTVDQSRLKLVQAAEQATLAEYGNTQLFEPPNVNEAPPVAETDNHIVPLYNYAPAPLGIATFGLSNTTGTITPYILRTTSLEGTFSTTDPLGVQTTSPYFSSLQAYGAQLNTVLVNTTVGRTSGLYYWLQNVINYNPTTMSLSFENNIWNFSTPSGVFPSNSILHGLGRVNSNEYYAVNGPSITIPYPFTLDLYLNTTVGSYSGSPLVNEVYFNYSVFNSAGQHVCPVTLPTGNVCGMYDNVYFNSVVAVPSGSAQIEANGYAYNPLGLPTDMEMDWGIGTSSGANANINYADASVGVYAWNQTAGRYLPPPSTYNFGSETGETTTGAYGTYTVQANGQPVEQFRTGPGNLGGLWNATGTAPSAGAYALNYANVNPGNAFIAIAAGSGVTNQSYFQVAPTFGWFSGRGSLGKNIWLQPGVYTVEVMLSGYDMVSQTVTMTSSGASLSITLVKDSGSTVYTPLWAFSNQDLANLSTSGSGTSVSPYVLTAGQQGTASLAPVFGTLNDYLFIVWTGVWINGTTAHANLNPPPSLYIAYPTWWYFQIDTLAAAYGATPYSNQLPFYLFHAQNITVAHAASIGGWSSDIEVGHNYNAYVSASKNDLFYDNYFNVTSEGLEFLGAGASLSPVILFTAPSTTYTVTFTASGLPGGTPWSVTLGTTTETSTTTTIVFPGITNGGYSYTVGSVTAHTPSPASGTVTVSGVNVNQAIAWSAVGTTYVVDFTETGYATNAPWSVTLNGITETNYSSSIIFVGFANGPYSYTVNAVRGYTASPSSGTVTVASGKVTQAITFTAQGTVFSVSFSSVGLPTGSPWTVTLGGIVETSITTSLTFPGYTSATLSFTVTAVPGYSTYDPTGTLTVTGANQNNYVWGNTFNPYNLATNGYPGVSAPSTGLTVTEGGDHVYNNAFYTNGTASSSATYLNFWNATGGYQPASNSVTVNGFSLTGSILGQHIQGGNFWRNYGSVADPYGIPYVARASSPTGSASIGAGADFAPLTPYMPVALAATVPTALGVGLYAVSFAATVNNVANPSSITMRLAGVPVQGGLQPLYTTSPTNTTTVTSGSTTSVFYVPNGTYAWSVLTPTGAGLIGGVATGTVTVNGAGTSPAVSVTYGWIVTIKETGLTSGLTWAIALNGKLAATTAPHWLNITIAPGSYAYSISTVTPGWTATPSSGTEVVGTAAATLTTTFAATAPKTYSIFFTASGIFSGTSWSVTINGNQVSSTTGSLSFTGLVAGTYTYTVTAPAGYTANPASGSVTITSTSMSVGITFTPVTYTVTFTETGLTSGTMWGLSFNGVFHWGTAGSGASSITFQVGAGAYTWLMGHTNKTPSASSGSGTISGPLTVTITFS